MKRFTPIIATILLCGCLFITIGFRSNAMPGHNSVSNMPMYNNPSFNYHFQPNLLNTFNNLFPIYSYQKKVCRKPFTGIFFLKMNNYLPLSAGYNFQKFTFKTMQLGSHFLKVEGNSIYKKGNSLLLIPQSYIAPMQPAFHPERPQVVVPAAN